MSHRWRDFAVAALLFLCVAALGAAVRAGSLTAIDRAALLALAAPTAHHPVAVELVTTLGNPSVRLVVLGVALLALLLARRFLLALWLAIGVESGALGERVLKLVVARPRPALLPHLVAVHDPSFPSGHAANTLLLYGAIAGAIGDARWRRKLTIAAIVLALIVGVSRIALAVHWPSDVVAGWALGGGWLLLARAVRPRLAGVVT